MLYMKFYNWDKNKNKELKTERGISFEEIIFYLENNKLIEDIKNPNREKYENQRMFVIEIKNYAYLIPYVETKDEIFFKTIIPSRKATRKYLGKEKDHEKNR